MLHPGAQPSDNLRGEKWLLALLLAIVLVPFWAVHYLPTTDGGAHLANADVIRHFVSGREGNYGNFYSLNPRPVPNWLGHFLLAGLLAVFPAAVAEKVFMSAYLVLLPIAVRYAIRSVKRSAGFLAFISVPLSLNWITHQGFYNFSGSVVVFFFALGYWLRRRDRMNLARSVILCAMTFLLYAGHLSSILIFAATLGILAAWFTFAHWYRAHPTARYSLPRDIFARVVVTGLALLPAVGLAVWFQRHGFEGKPPGMKLAILDKSYWKNLLQLSFLISFRRHSEIPFARGTALLIWLTLAGVTVDKLRRRSFSRRDGLLLVPAALISLYFLQGSPAHGALFIPQRLTYYATLTLLPFFAAQRFPAWARYAITFAAALLAIGFTAAHWKPFKEYDAQLTEYIDAGNRIEPHATFLPLIFAPRGYPGVSDPPTAGLRVIPFFSAEGHIAIHRKAIDLRNYEAGLDYFPVRFLQAVDPFKHLANTDPTRLNGLMDVPQRVDISAYESVAHVRVDYVLLWGLAAIPESKRDPSTLRTLERLNTAYDLVFSSPNARAQLWRRKATAQ